LTERIEGMSIGLGLDTIQMERGLTGLKDRLKTLNSEMKANLSAFDRGEQSVEKYEATLQGLSQKLELQKRIVRESRAEYDKMVQKFGEGSRQAEAAARSYNNQLASLNNLQRAFNRTSQGLMELESSQRSVQSKWGLLSRLFDDTSSSLTNMGEKAKNVGTSLSTSLTLPIAGAGAGIMGLAAKFDSSAVKIQNSLGATAEETKQLTATSKRIYEDGYGESLEEVDNALLQTRQNVKGLNDEDLEKVTKKAMTLANTFEADVNEVTRAGGNVMKGFGIDSEKAFDLMAWGAQKGMNFSNEMFDNLSEYAPLYKQMGFSAEDYFQLLAQGSQSGVYNLDYINDAMKEFQIRLKDGSDGTAGAMASLSESTQKTFASFQNGKATVKDLHNAVLADLKGMDNQVKANQIGVALYGK
jgi:phage-related minor tail protein